MTGDERRSPHDVELLRAIADEFGRSAQAISHDPVAVEHRAAALVDVVELALADHGEFVLHPQTLSVATLVAMVVDHARPRGVVVDLGDAGGVQIAGDAPRLARSLRTLWFGASTATGEPATIHAAIVDDRVALGADAHGQAGGALAERAARSILAAHEATVDVHGTRTTVSFPIAPWVDRP